ncbi:TPA: VapC toxin family PIN domain ribonuclease [Candidatus Delongbacteria bacterium]|nr:VapC toxin family PIN domain ribonuclease [Candidatus Delongbacteria bacterium]
MGYLIDTNTIIYSIKNNIKVNERFKEYLHVPKALSMITYAELYYGAKKSAFPEKNLAIVRKTAEFFPVIEITRPVIETFADIKVYLSKKGLIVSDFDIIIGATALTMNYTLVTNDAHFERIPGLNIENWTV